MASPTMEDEAGESAESEKRRIKEARRRRRELRKKMKREGTWVKGMDETIMNELMLEEEEDEKFKRCIEVLKRMGREEDLAEVMRIEQRLTKLRELRRQRLEKERLERQASLPAAATSDSSESSSDDSDDDATQAKKKAAAGGKGSTKDKSKEGDQQGKGGKKEEKKDADATKKLSKKERVRLWKEREAENNRLKGEADLKSSLGKKPQGLAPLPPAQASAQGAVVVITVRHLVALVLTILAALVAFVWFLLFFVSSQA